jgi:hypothetical protein
VTAVRSGIRRASLRLLAACCAAAALGLAGCGGDDDGSGSGEDPRELLAQAFAASAEKHGGSGVAEGSLDVSIEGERGGSFAFEFGGPYDGDSAQFDFSVEGEGVPSFEAAVTVLPDNAYVGWEDRTYELGEEATRNFQRISKEYEQTGTGFREQCRLMLTPGDASVCDEIDPSAWLSEVTDEGTDELDGVETTKVDAQVDVERAATDFFRIGMATLPPGMGESIPVSPEVIGSQAANFVDEAGFQVYVGEDDIPRRVIFQLGAEFQGTRASFNGELNLTEVGEPQAIAAPPGPIEPVSALREQLPPELAPLLDCFLESRTAVELNRCSTAVGSGTTGPMNLNAPS